MWGFVLNSGLCNATYIKSTHCPCCFIFNFYILNAWFRDDVIVSHRDLGIIQIVFEVLGVWSNPISDIDDTYLYNKTDIANQIEKKIGNRPIRRVVMRELIQR